MNDKEEFIKKLTSIEGIGRAKALQIYENNFDSIEKIKKASIEDLAKIKGISKD
ncbi:MAG TPA: 50S ribosomal protein L32e, partial [Thermoplasmatales archaeon]|nr:50S ribosomal protein L32e [Thermoplasmatales archaeon]